MTDFTSDTPVERVHKTPKTEFYVYFLIIFLAALPLATISWALSMLRQRKWSNRGPVARAFSQARIITPMIFSA
ncbi:cytochrome PufQ [Parasulfitobacter algicola]|uniref:Protein pufQ n=1 Tax=Parasulfitobacter algicola TaxID=2614809 RepID=A0ABX2IK50_9RHOB|nr:cytochrome PufQ [Sulfitobacter algicola]NSX53223.1 protein pufQ [Sulfitobacter algicola]